MKKLALIVMLAMVMPAQALPIFEVTQGGIKVVLFDEDCALPMPSPLLTLRATWTENGKVFEGCYAKLPDHGIAAVYFPEDKSLVQVPLSALKRVSMI